MANKNNIFKRFDSVMANADKGKPYAVYCYMRFCENFSKDDIALIEKFRAVYTVKQNNLVSSIQSFSEKEAKVIHKFIDFAQDLPATKFTGWLRRIFGISFKDKQKNETKSYEDKIEDSNIDSYISKRWLEQRKYFSKKSQESQRKFHRNQRLIIVLSALSVVVLSVDIDSIISNRFDSNIEQEAQFTFYCANSLYELNRMQCTLNQEKQERNRKEYVELVKKSALNQKLLDQNIEEYNSLIEEYESLKKELAKAKKKTSKATNIDQYERETAENEAEVQRLEAELERWNTIQQRVNDIANEKKAAAQAEHAIS